jgi:four helix bundle protein
MTTEMNRPGAYKFIALERAIQIVASLARVERLIRRRSSGLADQIERASGSIAANLGEGNRRQGRDRLHFFRIAAGSADETRMHLRVAMARGWITGRDAAPSLDLIDQELAILWRLTQTLSTKLRA